MNDPAMLTMARAVAPTARAVLAAWLAAALAALAGCAVGPDFARPSRPAVTDYVAQPAVLPTAGPTDVGQHLQWGANLDQHWWTAFHSSDLDDTVSRAIAGSPTLDTARATLAQAQQAILIARGGLYPQIDAGASAQRDRARGARGGDAGLATTNLLTVGPTVSYTLDLFGGTRRAIEAQTATADYQRYQLAAAYLTLTGNTVTQALTAASAREQLRAVQDIIALDKRNVELVSIEREVGKAALSDVLAARSQLAADLALSPALAQQLSAADHALAVLVGQTPAQWQAPPFDFSMLTLPADIPIALPSVWLEQRPDIKAAEAQLHAASAAIGVATAQLYPHVTLSAAWTQAAASMGPLFQSSNGLWTVAAALTAPLFHGGALTAQKQAAVDAFDAQLGIYRQTVLQAFGQVADTLRALEHDADELAAQRAALDAAQTSLSLLQESYRVGTASLVDLLFAQRLFAQARLGYAKAKGQRYVDTAQWFAAMGGSAQAWVQESGSR
ncbi:efflux transporter outer membrane subunit [Trinickia soli]|uniref:RND transporter n=1 Tax=Trinickia soli TaxID=380675 RepID=A0A2N7W9L0_9BURK|nr:efflux transporter outer membrane subunit [Trinickia soli]PMS26087.1 RND transporter [Trinickia soli]CAB3681198.1 putative efflux pump outer membrane protein TtgC [Trinickia soli]